MTRALAIILFLIVAGASASAAWWVGYRSALVQVADRGDAYLRAASDRLIAQLSSYRLVAVRLADHPIVSQLAQGAPVQAAATDLFLRVADETGALEVTFMTPDGRRLAGSDATMTHALAADPALLARANTGALGIGHGETQGSGLRAYTFMAPVFSAGKPAGALIVRVDLEAVEESDWRGSPHVVFFTDQSAQIFVANRSEILFQTFGQTGFAPDRRRFHSGVEIWTQDDARYLPTRSAYRTLPVPVIGLTGHVLISTEPADRIAALQASVVAALFLAFGAVFFLLSVRRRTLALANAQLEARVSERTQELAYVNDTLRHEIGERKEAEAALRKAQSDLVQAGKLSALGQMSAGISHELNQPLMAIRSFSENAVTFLERGDEDAARSNLGRISDLAHRMARIIKNLRAFARQENEPMSRVNISSVVDTVLELLEPRIKLDGAKVTWNVREPMIVMGGEVRLQQVVMNLITNALDAMSGQDDRQLSLSLTRADGVVRFEVADNGPGLDDPDKIFDPFYTTKAVGHTEDGMGLGLSISYGLVQSFGGAIRGRNNPNGGAVFTVELRAADQQEAAE